MSDKWTVASLKTVKQKHGHMLTEPKHDVANWPIFVYKDFVQ